MLFDIFVIVFFIENYDVMYDFVCFVFDILIFFRFIFYVCLDFCILWLLLLFKRMIIIK